jgi:hypothetical protein
MTVVSNYTKPARSNLTKPIRHENKMCNEAIIHIIISYVISDNGWWGSYTGLRKRKAKNVVRKLHNEEILDLNNPQVLLGDKMNKDEKKGMCHA